MTPQEEQERQESVRQQAIQDAAVAKDFLDNEVIKRAFTSLEVQYINEMRSAETPGARDLAWAKDKALVDILIQLRATLSSGERARIEQAREDRRREANQPRRPNR